MRQISRPWLLPMASAHAIVPLKGTRWCYVDGILPIPFWAPPILSQPWDVFSRAVIPWACEFNQSLIFGPLGSRSQAVNILGRNLKINRLPTSQADQIHSQISTTTKDLLNAYAQGQEKWWIFRYLEFWNIREPYSCPWCEHLSTTVEWHNWIQRFLTWIESHRHDRTTIFEVIHIEYILIHKVIYFNFSKYGYVMW